MLVNPIVSKFTPQHRPAFKSDIIFDIGGSQREGSCKIYYSTTKTNDQLFKKDTTVNQLGKKTFVDSSDFIHMLINKIGEIQSSVSQKKSAKDKNFAKEEKPLKNVTIFLPSYTSNNFAFYLPNHRDKDSKPLKDLDFRNFREKKRKNSLTAHIWQVGVYGI